tara:strand:+ start:222 stop:2135 length:1914 start_codon:yes stop_codon:yes gene_type:complete
MPLVNFTNLDFDQIKTSIKSYLRSNSNFTDYDFEGSNLSTIVDVLAYNTYISSYNANMVSNEVFIDSATLRENVVSLARNIGYVPRSRTAARSAITFTVDTTDFTTNPTAITLKKGVVASTSAFGGDSYTFAIPEDITVPVVDGVATFDSINIFEGEFLVDNFTVEAENPAPPQKYILSNSHIDTSTLRVLVRDTESSTTSRNFLLSDSLFDVTGDSRIYFIQEIEDQRYELIFGDGIFGEKLEELSFIEVSYIRTSGEEANGLSNFSFSGILVDNNNVSVADGISLITTITASESGKEIESVDSVKNYATKIYASQNRAVTAADYEALIPKIYPETQSVSVFGGETLSPPQFGKVFITIKPFFGPFVPNSIKDNLKNILRRYSVAGIVPEILDLKYLYIETDSTVYYNENLAPGSDFVKSIVSTNVDNYSNSTELNKYGARFKYSRFQNIIDNSHESITSNITKVQIRRDMKAKLNQLANYEICFGNEFYIKRLDGYNIKSSGFRVFGVDDVVYLGDVPNQDQVTGEIFLFKLNSPTQPGIVRRSVGTINYQKGEILLDNINIVSTSKTVQRQPIIEISACPRSNDVIGLQDLYLQLNTSNSVLNMLSDEVASGADPSGTTYITTSSYTNGNLVRS